MLYQQVITSRIPEPETIFSANYKFKSSRNCDVFESQDLCGLLVQERWRLIFSHSIMPSICNTDIIRSNTYFVQLIKSVSNWKFTLSKRLLYSVRYRYTIDNVAKFLLYIHNNLPSFVFLTAGRKKNDKNKPKVGGCDWRSCSQLLCTFNFLLLFILLASIYFSGFALHQARRLPKGHDVSMPYSGLIPFLRYSLKSSLKSMLSRLEFRG